jgi:hypothetical protein
MKRIFKLDRLQLRGLSGAKDEVLLTAIAQNLRRLVKFLCRPPPAAAVTCAAYACQAYQSIAPPDGTVENTTGSAMLKSGRAVQSSQVLQHIPPNTRHSLQ